MNQSLVPRLLLVALLFSTVYRMEAQSVVIPLRHEIYGFLKKMEAKGLITDHHDIVRPLSRKEAAARLLEIASSTDQLTQVDLRRLTFLQEEFAYELGFLDPSWSEAPRHWHLLSVPISGGILNVHPIIGFLEKRSDGKRMQKITNGINLYGYAFGSFGVLFSFADNHEQGALADRVKRLTPEDGIPGLITSRSSDQFSYNYTDAQFSYETGDLLFSLEKVPQSWSTGRRGSLSFSSKAPSAPQLRLQARLTDWITFTYIHAELNSGVIDSSRTYHAQSSSISDFVRPVYRQKYLAAHMLELTPIDGIDIALGESIVYSDQNPSLLYLLPVMFFKSGEHYNYDSDNTQFHISADITLIPDVNLYGSLIIDEIWIGGIFKSSPYESRNQVGFTAGLQTFDLPIADLEFNLEYTLVNPWVYSHKFPAATFANNGYDMGHWIGQNADNVYGSLTYWIDRSLTVTTWYEMFRKGGRDDVAFQYRMPSREFLYGPRRTERSLGVGVRYQPVRDLHLEIKARSFSLTDEANPSQDHGQLMEVLAQLRYGLW